MCVQMRTYENPSIGLGMSYEIFRERTVFHEWRDEADVAVHGEYTEER